MSKKTLKCGHELYDRELSIESGIVFIKYNCVEGCSTEWVSIGEIPEPNEVKME